MKYDVDFFLDKFEKIPENKWCVWAQTDGQYRHCALGWCHPDAYKDKGYVMMSPLTDEAIALYNLFYDNLKKFVVEVNNDDEGNYYQQPTPKQRILAALRDVKKMQTSQNTVSKEPGVQECDATKPIVAMGWPNKTSSFTNIIEVVDETSDLILNETI